MSPYSVNQNSPIAMADKEGMHGEIVITKKGKEKGSVIQKIDINVLVLLKTEDEKRGSSGGTDFVTYVKTYELKNTYERKSFEGKVDGQEYTNASFNFDIRTGLTVSQSKAIYLTNHLANVLTVNGIDVVTNKMIKNGGAFRSIDFNTTQKAGFSYPLSHEFSHILGGAGDNPVGVDYMSNYVPNRNVQNEEVNEILAPAIRLANEFAGKEIIIHFFSGTDQDGTAPKGLGQFNTYRVYDPQSCSYLKSVTVPMINPTKDTKTE